jgi:integrase
MKKRKTRNRYRISDELWEKTEPLIRKHQNTHRFGGGRPRVPDRKAMDGTFHGLRSTCITEWLEQGLMPHEVKELAGHADINTTMNYYVGIRESLIDRARGASSAALGEDSSAHFVRATQSGTNGKKQAISRTSQALDVSGVTRTCGDIT